MSLDPAARRRYARQVLLGEIGEAGQERLFDTGFFVEAGSDAAAAAVATDYLCRAGCRGSDDGDALSLPDESTVAQLAGTEALRMPAAAVVGAFFAVERIKEVLGVGTTGHLDFELQLTSET